MNSKKSDESSDTLLELEDELTNLSPAVNSIDSKLSAKKALLAKQNFLKSNKTNTQVNQLKLELDVGDLFIRYLEQIGVEYVFGVPGGALEPLYNSISKSQRQGGIKPIVARHETSAVFMAQGYAKETGRVGVCCATTGPGATNAITGVASAYYEEVPMLLITVQTTPNKFGRGAFQDSSHNGVDILGIFQHCTRYNTVITDAAQFESELLTALMFALDNPPGPVHITIPTNLMRQSLPLNKPSFNLKKLLRRPSLIDINSIEELAAEIDNTTKIVILVGEGCTNSINQIMEFAEYTNALFVTTPGAKGLTDPYHLHYRGVVGFAGHLCAIDVLNDPSNDYIFVAGSALCEWDIAGWNPDTVSNAQLIHFDSSVMHLARSFTAGRHVRGDIKTAFTYLHKELKEKNNVLEFKKVDLNFEINENQGEYEYPPFFRSEVDELDFIDDRRGLKPQQLMLELAKRAQDNTRFFADVGNSTAWAVHYLFPNMSSKLNTEKLNWFGTSVQFASMGWAIGNAIGAAIGNDKLSVICITGDGSLLMNGQEFTVAVAKKLNIIFIVLNDSAYGMVKHGQRLTGAEQIAFELPRVNFSSMAKAMGGQAHQIRTLADLRKLNFSTLNNNSGPTLLDVYIDSEEVPPMGTRVKNIRGEL